MVRSVSAGKHTFITDDYLVLEVAVFPDKGAVASIDLRRFTLHLNGKKTGLLAQSPTMVAASLKYPDWNMQRGAIGSVGAGGRDIIFGRPPVAERFPGDNREAQRRLPRPPRVPDSAGGPEVEAPDYPALAVQLALPEGPSKFPVSGFVYFPHRGKLSSVKKVELRLATDSGETVSVKLR